MKNPVTPRGIDPGTVRIVAQRLNHYATPGPPTCISHVEIQHLKSWNDYLACIVCRIATDVFHCNQRIAEFSAQIPFKIQYLSPRSLRHI